MQDGVMMGGGGGVEGWRSRKWVGVRYGGAGGWQEGAGVGGGGVRGQDVNKETVTIGAGGERVQLGH